MNAADPTPTRVRRPRWMRVLGFTRRRRVGMAVLVLAALVLSLFDGRVQRDRRNEMFDLYQHLVPRQRVNDSVVIVAIDDASLQALGQWPWPRSKLAEIVEHIAAQHPAAIGIDAIFAEPDRLSPRQEGQLLARQGYTGIASALEQLPDYDEQFAAALRRAPVVLGIGALSEDAGLHPVTPLRATILGSGGDPAPFAPAWPAALRNVAVIDAAAAGHGVLPETSEDGVLRRIPTLVRLGPDLLPTLPVEILRLVAGEPALRVSTSAHGIHGLHIGRQFIPTDRDGQWWLHFSDPGQRPHIAVADLLQGKAPADALSGRIVLIGYTALGLQDVIVTPQGRMPGVEALAEALDNFIDGRLLQRPQWSHAAETGVLALLSLLLVIVVPWLRPISAAGIFLLCLAALFAAGLLLFRWQGWLIDVANPAIGATLVFAIMLAMTLSEAMSQRSRLRQALQESHVSTARLEGELDAARRIQTGMLPARSVGGDLYDFFLLDESRLFIMVGDVSGKGLPASLFMALSKALTKGAALRSNADPGRTLRDAGAAIAEENPELLFVTVLAAVLNLDSGRLDWCSAGHEPPWVLPASGAVPYRLTTAGGPPLCVIENYDYRSETLQLAPGDALCILTDGLGDAQNRGGEFFGGERVARAMARNSHGESAPYIVESLLAETLAWSEGAEQADDITILALRWHGPAAEAPQSIEAKTARM